MIEYKQFILNSIGDLGRETNKTFIHLKDQYVRGQKQMKFFSHLRVFWWNTDEV